MESHWSRNYRVFMMAVMVLGVLGVAGSFIAQFGFGMKPCNMCILQRVAMIGIALFSILFVAFSARRRIWKFLQTLIVLIPTVGGLVVSIRQIWLQNLPPDKVPSCGAGYGFVWRNNPALEAVKILFMGDGDCAKLAKFLGVPMSWWAALFFSMIIVMAFAALARGAFSKAGN